MKMTNMQKRVLVVVIFLYSISMVVPSYTMAQQDKTRSCDIKKIYGNVATFNWVGSLLVVDTGPDQLSLVVSKSTVFTKRGVKIMFSDINLSDAVVVEYFDCGFAGLKAISVNVTS